MPVTILIVDDHKIICDGIGLMIKPYPEFSVVGYAYDGYEALQQIKLLQPNIGSVWLELLSEGVADTAAPFEQLPKNLREQLCNDLETDVSIIDASVIEQYGSWQKLFVAYVSHYNQLISDQRIREVSRLVMKSNALPSKPELLARYQTALDNDLYKSLKALREAQAWRNSRAVLSATPVGANADTPDS